MCRSILRGADAAARMKREFDTILKKVDAPHLVKSNGPSASSSQRPSRQAAKILVFATSVHGRALCQTCINAGVYIRIAIDHSDQRKLFSEFEWTHCEIVSYQLDQPSSVRRLLRGIEVCHYAAPSSLAEVSLFYPLLLEAFSEVNGSRLLIVGFEYADFLERPDPLTSEYSLWIDLLSSAEQATRRSGIPFIFTRISTTMELVSHRLGDIIKGTGALPFCGVFANWISSKDLTDCWLSLIQEPRDFLGQKLNLTTSKAFSMKSFAAAVSKSVGRHVPFEEISAQAFQSLFQVSFGMSATMARVAFGNFMTDSTLFRTTDDAQRILRRPLETMEDWIMSHSHFFI